MKKTINGLWSSKIVLILLTLCLSMTVFAQQIPITGKVIQADGETLPGVTVVVKGTSQGTVTNIDGVFNINAPSDATLILSFVGFTPQEVAVNGKSTLNVTLATDVIGLEEVVAIGYGTTKKRDITGSVGSISSEKLLAAPISSLDKGLQGKIAGVSVQQTSGAPGQGMKIRIRGGSSINYSNSPLYVIDGFIGADITSINPNDIAQIDILKDASATAIYGSRGANGVILITTTAPTEGEFRITADANVSFSNMINTYDRLSGDEQMELFNSKIDRIFRYTGVQNDYYFSQDQINEYKNGSKKTTDWVDLVTQAGLKQNYTVSAQGGKENLKYYVSMNHLDEKGTIQNTFFKRTSIRSNINAKLTDKIDLKFNTFAVHKDTQGNAIGTGGMGNVIGLAASYPQLWSAYNDDGSIADPFSQNDYNGAYKLGERDVPVEKVRQNQESLNDRIISNLDLTFDLGHNLSLFISTSGSYTSGYNANRTLEDQVSIDRNGITAKQAYSRNVSWMNTDILSYENSFGEHDLKVDAVYEYSKYTNRGINGTVGTLSTLANEWYLLGNGTPTALTSNYATSSMRSWMGRVNYGFSDKYLFTAALRADGTSIFNEDYRWGYFPSAALAWRVSEEGFIKDLGWVHNFKVRAGFGATGNTAVGPYATMPSFITDVVGNNLSYPLEGDITENGIIPAAQTNPDLKWETTTQYNLGVDYAMFGGRLSAVFDVYSKQASDVIIATSIPRYTGFESYTNNYADISNKGIELGINGVIMENSDFSWDVNFNITSNKNEVKSLGGDVDEIFIADEEELGIWSLVGGNSKFIVRNGESMGSLFGLKALGLWQEDEQIEAAKYGAYPGEVKYEDLDGSGDYSASDRQIVGNTQPKFTYGFGTSFSYKDFDLAIQCVGAHGNDIYNWAENVLSQQARLISSEYSDRWTPTNTDATRNAAIIGADLSMNYVVSQYVEDGSFFKVSNATLGYTLPSRLTDKLSIRKLRLFVSADNLLTITKYSGLDPEASSTPSGSDSQAGIDAFSYPLTRTFQCGVKINF